MEERTFSELLGYYIQKCGYTNYEFARIVGINRVNIQRYLAGVRVPNRQNFEKIADELHLGKNEQEEFFECYQCAFEGKDAYYMKRIIRDMLEHSAFVCGEDEELAGVCVQEDRDGMGQDVRMIQGTAALERCIWALLYRTFGLSQEERVYCFLPADRMIVWKMVPSIVKEGGTGNKRKIVHMIPIARRTDLFRENYYNLQVLRNLLPAYYHAGERYEALYYYCESPQLERNDGLLYPYYLVGKGYVLLMDVRLESALLIKNSEIAEQYMERIKGKIGGGGIQCFGHVLKEEAFNRDLKNVQEEEGGKRVWLEYGVRLSYNRDMHYFTEQGLYDFTENGYSENEFGEIVYIEAKEERIAILERMMEEVEQNTACFGMIRRRYLNMEKQMSVCLESSGELIFLIRNKGNVIRRIQITESSVVRAFDDYMKIMQKQEEIYSCEEMKALLKKCLELLKRNA